MAKVKKEVLKAPNGGIDTGRILFFCPACQDYHALNIIGGKHPVWSFNGDYERPTFQPSVLYRSGHYMDGKTDACWCKFNAEHPDDPAPFKCTRCHSFVTDGRIQYLSDCSHTMAGQIVDLPDIED
jgi:hypothetical protein